MNEIQLFERHFVSHCHFNVSIVHCPLSTVHCLTLHFRDHGSLKFLSVFLLFLIIITITTDSQSHIKIERALSSRMIVRGKIMTLFLFSVASAAHLYSLIFFFFFFFQLLFFIVNKNKYLRII